MAPLRTRSMMAPPEANPMNPLILLPLLVLTLPLPARAQLAADSEVSAHRPLNLSLPRDLTRPPAVSFGTDAPRDPVADNLRAAQVSGGPGRIPYGSGYEARQRGAGHENGAAPRSVPSGSGHGSGMRSGSGGRGGMGRGR